MTRKVKYSIYGDRGSKKRKTSQSAFIAVDKNEWKKDKCSPFSC